MFNPIAFVNQASSTATAVTLGYAPGQTTPPQLLIMSPTANATVTLPPTSSQPATPPTINQTTVGTSGGYRITVFNTTTWTVSVAPATGDTVVGITSVNGVNSKFTLQAAPALTSWYVVA